VEKGKFPGEEKISSYTSLLSGIEWLLLVWVEERENECMKTHSIYSLLGWWVWVEEGEKNRRLGKESYSLTDI
jgi:hypothetical protein